MFFLSDRDKFLKRGPCILLSVTLTFAHVLNSLLRCGVMMFVYVCGASCVDYIFGRPCSECRVLFQIATDIFGYVPLRFIL